MRRRRGSRDRAVTRDKVAATGPAIGGLSDPRMALKKLADIPTARGKYRIALERDPTAPVLRLTYGGVWCRLGLWPEAVRESQGAPRRDANNADAPTGPHSAHVTKLRNRPPNFVDFAADKL